jgi:hypothetical protein
MYSVYHPDYQALPWNVYIASLIVLWSCVGVVIFCNRLVPYTQHAGTFFVVVGGVVSIIVLAAMPKQHASNQFVWNSFDENNLTGWPAGVAFLTVWAKKNLDLDALFLPLHWIMGGRPSNLDRVFLTVPSPLVPLTLLPTWPKRCLILVAIYRRQ